MDTPRLAFWPTADDSTRYTGEYALWLALSTAEVTGLIKGYRQIGCVRIILYVHAAPAGAEVSCVVQMTSQLTAATVGAEV
jgi:hypothetical protein